MPIEVRFPATWGRVLDGVITVDVPEQEPTVAATGEAVTPDGVNLGVARRLGPNSEDRVRLVRDELARDATRRGER